MLHDLLAGTKVDDARNADRDRGTDLKIRRDPEHGIYVQNLTEVGLSDASGLATIIEQGNRRRATAATLMNSESSRSHAVVILLVERHDHESHKKKGHHHRHHHMTAKLNLVDLAGSERVVKSGATGETLKEAIAINQSLSMLGTVINALTDVRSATHIPYRSSKLTYLLEESLGGNSHTVMLATCSPSTRSYFESTSTLQYAVRAKLIHCNPKANYGDEHEAHHEDQNAEEEGARRAEFHYLPRHVRVHGKGHHSHHHGKHATLDFGPATVANTPPATVPVTPDAGGSVTSLASAPPATRSSPPAARLSPKPSAGLSPKPSAGASQQPAAAAAAAAAAAQSPPNERWGAPPSPQQQKARSGRKSFGGGPPNSTTPRLGATSPGLRPSLPGAARTQLGESPRRRNNESPRRGLVDSPRMV